MRKIQDLTGRRYARLTAEKFLELKGGRCFWRFRCQCGGVYEGMAQSVKCGDVVGCRACGKKTMIAKRTRHGGAVKTGPRDRLYSIWLGMRSRCNTVTDKNYRHYGGRGIKIVAAWDEFDAFKTWALANGYEAHLTVDRRDGNMGYSPENCRWVTQAEQVRNTSRCRKMPFKGRDMFLFEIAELTGISDRTMRWRLSNGWSIGDATTTKPGEPRHSAASADRMLSCSPA